MIDLRAYLYKLHNNLNILREREAKYASEAPPGLLNKIEDHQQAIDLTQRVLNSELSEIEWREALKPLLVSLSLFGDFFGPRVPLQRPTRAQYFTNREAELNQLLTNLQPGETVTLCGPGGIGKSALAAEAVWVLAPGDNPPNLFPDGIIFHSFSSQPQVDLALESIARALGDEPNPTPRDAAQRALAGRQVLLVLDGTENADNLPALLGITGKCGVLITSRTSEDAPGDWQDIAPLPFDEAVKLLQAWAKDWAKDRDTARRICELVDGLPLAVHLIGRYLSRRKQKANTYLTWLEASPLQATDQGEQSVPLLLERSLAQVSDEAKGILAVAGLFALAPFDGAVLAGALDVPIHQTDYLLGELVSYGLLLRPQDRYEVSHALIHTYARQRLQVSREVLERLASYYTDFAKKQSELELEGYIRLDHERANILAVLSMCVEQEAWKAARSLYSATIYYLGLRGQPTELVIANKAGLAIMQATGDRREEGILLGRLGAADLNNKDRADQTIEYLEQALAIAREVKDRQNEGKWLRHLGFALHTLKNQTERAIENIEEALIIAQEENDLRGEIDNLRLLGITQRETGNVEQAVKTLERALTLAREINEKRLESYLLGSLGYAYYEELEEVEQGVIYVEKSLNIAFERGDTNMQYRRLKRLNEWFQKEGRPEKSLKYFEQALANAREIGDQYNQAGHLYSIGKVYKELGNISKAKEYLRRSLEIHEEINSIKVEPTRKFLRQLENEYPGD